MHRRTYIYLPKSPDMLSPQFSPASTNHFHLCKQHHITYIKMPVRVYVATHYLRCFAAKNRTRFYSVNVPQTFRRPAQPPLGFTPLPPISLRFSNRNPVHALVQDKSRIANAEDSVADLIGGGHETIKILVSVCSSVSFIPLAAPYTLQVAGIL